ncbi:MAG: CDP-alcohol phosphatidyltransferase family protein [Clostridia bacterium]|nr:CDP-alcohol phosphatidyltransferase family protein [Clostridia bacterium]
MANIITSVRIVCSVELLFCPVFSPSFYILYVAAGISDIADGAIARKTGSAGKAGAVFDTVADMVFTAVCLIKLVPALNIGVWLIVWISFIVFVRVMNIVSGFIMKKKFIALHSPMNRITGGLLFVLPLTMSFIAVKYSAPVVCAVATFASVQEGYYITERYSDDGKIENNRLF